MDGAREPRSAAARGQRNGLINTRSAPAEGRDGPVPVRPAPQHPSCRRAVTAPGAPDTPRSPPRGPARQPLDPGALPRAAEPHFRANILFFSEAVLRPWADGAADCCETTFIEGRSPAKDGLERPEGRFLDLSADDIKIHTLSYDVDDDEEFQELEVRGLFARAFRNGAWDVEGPVGAWQEPGSKPVSRSQRPRRSWRPVAAECWRETDTWREARRGERGEAPGPVGVPWGSWPGKGAAGGLKGRQHRQVRWGSQQDPTHRRRGPLVKRAR